MARNLTPAEVDRLKSVKAELKLRETVAFLMVGSGWIALLAVCVAVYMGYLGGRETAIFFVLALVWLFLALRTTKTKALRSLRDEERRIKAVTQWEPMARRD